MLKKKKQSGFIALTSVLLFGALILIMGLSMASSSISEQAMTGYEKGGEKAVSAANSCVDIGVSRVKSGEVSYTDIDQYNNINLYLYDDVYCSLSFEKDPDYSYRVKVTGTATTNTGQRSFSHTEYAYVDNHDFIPGLVGYWPMDESRGHAVYNKASDDRESYLDFDGVSNYVEVPSPIGLPIGSQSRTISFWTRPSVYAAKIWIWWGASLTNEGNGLRLSPNGIRYYFWGNDLDVIVPNLDDGSWYHIVALYNEETNNQEIFVNGSSVGSRTPTIPNTASSDLYIGMRDNSEFFQGYIDDVRIYNRALSEVEIQKLYNETENITNGLVGHWEMDETFGDLAVDSSGNNNHGTIYGAKRGGSKGKYVGIEAFTEVGEHTWTVPEGVTEVDVLVVGGGGGSGDHNSGGGGAGGLVFNSNYLVTPGEDVSIIVGNGGSGGSYSGGGITNGGNSLFGQIVAFGGGAGGAWNIMPSDGGSGAGGNAYSSENPLAIGRNESQTSSVSGGFGNRGGDGFVSDSLERAGGGGGGAGEAGQNAESNNAGDGGRGLYFGQVFGNQYGENGWFAGGGGGAPRNSDGVVGMGGLGGGASGFYGSVGGDINGIDGTGGGAGGRESNNDYTVGGNGGSGIVIIRYTKWIDGRNDKALDFDGVSNYVEIPYPPVLADFSLSDFSIGFWTKINSLPGQNIFKRFIDITRNTSPANNFQFAGTNQDNQLQFYGHHNGVIYGKSMNPGSTPLNKWIYVVGTWTTDTKKIALYVDGIEQNGSVVGTPTATMDNAFNIGRRVDGEATSYFDGLIDDVRIYNRALTEDEIKFLYQRGLEYHVNR